MTTDFIGNASGFEILFFCSALLGLWISRKNFREAADDYRALEGVTNGRQAVAVGSLITETILLSVHGLYIVASLIAFFIPYSGITTIVGVLIQSILVFASWGMTAISYISRRTRLYLMQYGLQARDDKGRFTKV